MVGFGQEFSMESSDVAEIKRHFNVVAEGFEKKLQLVAEGVSALDERMTSLEEKMERGFDEVKAMIKFSYAELDRRVASLEAGLAKLEVRVLKVEAR
jgi:uncharacterized small protein (DUF1192 family)